MEASNHSFKKVYHPWRHIRNHPKGLSSIEASKNSFKGVHHPWRHQIIHPKWPIILGGITTFIQKDPSFME
jgi:hypothetical protein